jgi:peptidoglycan/LPS O-acetylase OafA/YrhL
MNLLKNSENIDSENTKVTKQTKVRFWGLDLVRSIAIVFVLLSHGFQLLIPLGFWGVEIFFALSGYLIGGILLNELSAAGCGEKWSFKNLSRFWARRWFRTLPNYYFYLIIANILAFNGLGQLTGSVTSSDLRYLFFVQNIWPGQLAGFFGVTWSLCVEEWFYLVFPGLLLIVHVMARQSPRRAFFISAFILCIVPICLRVMFGPSAEFYGWDAGMRKIVAFRLDAILWGVMAAYFKRAKLVNSYFIAISLVLILLGFVCFWVNNEAGSSIAGLVVLTSVPMGVACILPIIETISVRGWFGDFVIYISKISYSLYLCHVLVIGIFVTLPVYEHGGPLTKLLLKFAQYVTIFLTASISYRWIEKPFLCIRDKVTG